MPENNKQIISTVGVFICISIYAWLLPADLYDVEDADNFKRNEFNELVRRTYGTENIFDIAKVESLHPDRRLEGFTTGSMFYNSLAHEYSTDGGHLNQTGSRVAAREFLRAVSAAIAVR
jgi:hypothetical protein